MPTVTRALRSVLRPIACGVAMALALPPGAQAAPAREGERPLSGLASYYGFQFHGRRMANGGRFDEWGDSCASRSLRFGTVLLLHNKANGRRARCTIRDRGPYVAGRVIDVSRGTARRLGMEKAGLAWVEIEILDGRPL
jgi:rare lipoprotein A